MNKIKIFISLMFCCLFFAVSTVFSAIYNNDNLVIHKTDTYTKGQTSSESGSVAVNVLSMSSKIPTITVEDGVKFSSNTTYVSGTILNSVDGILNIGANVEFSSNTAFESGGAIYNLNLTSVTTIGNNANFNSNKATNAGGAIYSMGNLTIGNNATFYGNGYNDMVVNGSSVCGANILTGGAVYQNGKNIKLGQNAKFNSNSAYKGGAMYVILSTVSIAQNAEFKNNTANYRGGAVYLFKSTFTIENGATFSSNKANDYGGAIYAFDSILNFNAKDREIKFEGNTAVGGGAIYAVDGAINLNSAGKDFDFGQGNSIKSTGTTVLNLNLSSNQVNFGDNVSMEGGTINLNSGRVIVNTYCADFSAAVLNLSSGIFNMSNATPLKVKVDTLYSTENVGLRIGISTTSDSPVQTVFDSFSISNKASGVINLSEIKIYSLSNMNTNYGNIALFQGGGDLEDLRIKISTKPTYGNQYAFFQSPSLGVLDYSVITTLTSNFLNSTETKAADMTSNSTLSAGTVNQHLAIYGNSKELTTNSTIVSSTGALSLFDLTVKPNANITNNYYFYTENVKFTTTQQRNIENLCNVTVSSTSKIEGSDTNVRFVAYDSSFNSISLLNKSIVTVKNSNKTDFTDFFVKVKLSSVSFSNATSNGAIRSETSVIIPDNVTSVNINNNIICLITTASFTNNTATNGGAVYSGISNIDVNNSSAVVINSGIEHKLVGNINFSSNKATNGGAIYSSNTLSSTVITKLTGVKKSSFTSNFSYSIGNNVKFSSNKATNGGAIYNYVGASTNTESGSVSFNTDFVISTNAVFSSNEATSNGGAIYNYNGEITFNDGVNFTSNKATNGGAIYNEAGTINLTAKEYDIIFNGNTGTGGAVFTDSGTINFIVYSSRTVSFKTSSDKMVSTSSGVINFNKGIKTENAGTIEINSDMSQVKGTTNLYSGTFVLGNSGTLFGGKTIIEDATFDFTKDSNNRIKNYDLSNFTINKKLTLLVDVDLQNKEMDTISSSADSAGSGSIYVKEFILKNNTSEKSVDILFTSSTVLKDKVSSVGKTFEASSPEYIYDVDYDKNTGFFTFINRDVANPTTLEGTVAMLAGSMATQENVLNQAFVSMTTSFTNRHDRRLDLVQNSKNLYASTENFIFFGKDKIEGGLWLRPYAYQEKVNIAKYDIDNTIYGALAGLDLKLTDDKLLSFYIGYTGVNQKFENIKVDQNGYVFGATGMLVKEQFYLGLTANVGVSDTKAESAKGTDDFQINTYLVGLKGGYEFKSKNWIFEPNLSLAYGFYGVENYKTNQGAKVAEDSINNFQIAPQLKISLSLLDGWKPYTLLSYIYNTGKTSAQVNDIKKKEEGIDPYYEYGIGLEKNFIGTPWVGYAQVTGKAGGKSGVGLNLGIKYAF